VAAAGAVVVVVVVVFEVVVAGASGTVGRFRSGGDFLTRGGRGLNMGRCHSESCALRDAAPATVCFLQYRERKRPVAALPVLY
jgi:hypothetical protein